LLYSFGYSLGKMDKILMQFHHTGANRYWHWDLKNALDIQKYNSYITDAGKRRLVDYFYLQYETEIYPLNSKLRKSIIHNDANDHNILVKNTTADQQAISGIIDFGDMVYTNTINELAIACAYIMFSKTDPLKSAAEVVRAYHTVLPLDILELNVLFYLIAIRLCMSATIAAYQQSKRPENRYLSISENQVWNLLEKLVEVNPLKAANLFTECCDFPAETKNKLKKSILLKKRKKHIGKSLSISYQEPLHLIRGSMQYLFDETGRTYLDCVNNVCHVGHCHPHVVKAAQRQMALLNTNTRYLHEYIVKYAKQLTDKMPDPLKICFFVNSGSEANELALRLAKIHTKQNDFIVLENAYHGHTTSLIDISPYKFDGPGGAGSRPYIHKVTMPDLYRGVYKIDDRQAGQKYAEEVHEKVKSILNKKRKPAAFICESVIGCGGQIVLPDGYLKYAYEHIHRAGGVCIADEVQVGFGRVGTHFWAFETQDVVPDIVTLGKPMGNGHPLAAVVTTPEIADSFNNGMEYFNTFGGNPVSCAVGLAVLNVIKNEKLQECAHRIGQLLKTGLEKLKEKHMLIGDVRGMGLFLGVEFVTDRQSLTPAARETKYVVEKMKENGILLSIDGPYHNVIKIKPPLVFNKKNVDVLLDKFDRVFASISLPGS